MSKHSLLAFVAFAATATPLVAQRTRVYEPRPRDTIVVRTVPGQLSGTISASRRAVIGVNIDMRPSPSDSIGATLSGVTPGGPAARAGLVTGDLITKFNGTALADRNARDSDDENDQSAPGMRLLELAARMAPGDTVTVEWRHERQRKTSRIVADAAPAMVYSNGGPDVRFYTNEGPGNMRYRIQLDDNGPAELRELEGHLEGLRGAMALPGMNGDHLFMRLGGPFGGIQFAPLIPAPTSISRGGTSSSPSATGSPPAWSISSGSLGATPIPRRSTST